MAAADQSLLDSRRAFPAAQVLLAGGPVSTPRRLIVGWHDTSVHPESGAFGLVGLASGLDDLIGEIVEVGFGPHLSVFVYVLDSADLPDPVEFSLARRAYWGLSRLSLSPIACQVVVTG